MAYGTDSDQPPVNAGGVPPLKKTRRKPRPKSKPRPKGKASK